MKRVHSFTSVSIVGLVLLLSLYSGVAIQETGPWTSRSSVVARSTGPAAPGELASVTDGVDVPDTALCTEQNLSGILTTSMTYDPQNSVIYYEAGEEEAAFNTSTDVAEGLDVGVSQVMSSISVDPSDDTVLIPGSITHFVSFVDGSTEQVITTVAVPGAPYASAYDSRNNEFYVTVDGGRPPFGYASVVVFNATSYLIIDELTVGLSPWGVSVDPIDNAILVSNFGSQNMSVIDGATNTVSSSIPLPGQEPEVNVYDPVSQEFYEFGGSNISRLNASSDIVVGAIPIPQDEISATDLAVDSDSGVLYFGENGTLGYASPNSSSIAGTISIWGSVGPITFDPTDASIWADGMRGSLYDVPTSRGATCQATSPNSTWTSALVWAPGILLAVFVLAIFLIVVVLHLRRRRLEPPTSSRV